MQEQVAEKDDVEHAEALGREVVDVADLVANLRAEDLARSLVAGAHRRLRPRAGLVEDEHRDVDVGALGDVDPDHLRGTALFHLEAPEAVECGDIQAPQAAIDSGRWYVAICSR